MQDSKPADSKSWETPELRKALNGFSGIPVKINKIVGIIHGIHVRLIEHLLQDFYCSPWGYADIFWNSPFTTQSKRYTLVSYFQSKQRKLGKLGNVTV